MTKEAKLFWFAALIIAILVAYVVWPLFRPGFFLSDDGEWMVIRLSAFYQSLAGGQFPVRYLGRLNNSFGYPVANFLYPGFLYIGSFLHFLGISFSDVVKIILGVSLVGGGVMVFATLRARFRMLPSLLGGASFFLAPYLLYDMYTRGSVGEVFALFVATVAIFALTKNVAWLLAPVIGLLIISHNTVAMIVGLAMIPMVWVHPARFRMAVAALLGVGLSSFFWMPALFEKNFVRFDDVVVSNPSKYFIGLENAGLLGLTTIISLAITLRKIGKRTPFNAIWVWLTIAGILMSLEVSKPLWKIGELGTLVQFPYRFLVLPVLFGPWVVAFAVEKLKGFQSFFLTLIFVAIWFLGATQQIQSLQYVERAESYYTTNEGTTTVADEYMPRWVNQTPVRRAVETLEVVSGDAWLSERTFIGETIRVGINAKETSIIQMNKIYYPGWGVTIDNRRVPIDYSNPLGVMRVSVPQGNHRFDAAFRETPFRFGADVVSVASLIVYLVVLGRLRIRA